MEEAVIQKPAISPNDRDPQFDFDSESRRVEPLFSGLNLKDLMLLTKSYQTTKPTIIRENHALCVENQTINQGVHGLFSGLHLAETFKSLNAMNKLSQTRNVVTVGQYLDDWVADNYPDPKTAAGRTRAGYDGYLRDYIKPQIRDIPLVELTP
jgi:hypothetical protein